MQYNKRVIKCVNFREESVKLIRTLNDDASKKSYNETTIQSIMSETTLNVIVG